MAQNPSNISIHGYTIVHHNGEPMIQDLELAKRLGYERPRKIRDLIKKMLERGQLRPEQVCPAPGRTTEKGGRPGMTYHLGEFASLKIATQAGTEKADEITDEIIHVFMEVRGSENAPKRRYVDPVIEKNRQAVAIAQTMLRLGKMFGTDQAMARAIAADQIRAATGMDVTPLLANNSVDEAPVTPTVLGKELGISGQKLNKKLEEQRLQERDENGDWMPTAKGKPFCTVNPYKAPNSDHTGYRVLWHRRVLEELTKTA